MTEKIVLYSAELCGDCQNLKAFLDKQGVSYETRDIHEDPEHARILEESTGKRGVPYMIINGQWKRGYQPGKPFCEDFARALLEA